MTLEELQHPNYGRETARSLYWKRHWLALACLSFVRDQTLVTLSRKLIAAHEQERSRIARELHEDICQRLSMLSHNALKQAASLPKALLTFSMRHSVVAGA